VHLHFAHLPHNWQNCAVTNTMSVTDIGTVLPPSTYYNFQRTTLHFLTTNKLKFMFVRVRKLCRLYFMLAWA
jgi:hypothetical protein